MFLRMNNFMSVMDANAPEIKVSFGILMNAFIYNNYFKILLCYLFTNM